MLCYSDVVQDHFQPLVSTIWQWWHLSFRSNTNIQECKANNETCHIHKFPCFHKAMYGACPAWVPASQRATNTKDRGSGCGPHSLVRRRTMDDRFLDRVPDRFSPNSAVHGPRGARPPGRRATRGSPRREESDESRRNEKGKRQRIKEFIPGPRRCWGGVYIL